MPENSAVTYVTVARREATYHYDELDEPGACEVVSAGPVRTEVLDQLARFLSTDQEWSAVELLTFTPGAVMPERTRLTYRRVVVLDDPD